MSTAADPAGPWEPLHQVWAVRGWDDCCPFWDDDGQGYLVATNFSDNYHIHLFKLREDGKELLQETDTIINQYKAYDHPIIAAQAERLDGLWLRFTR